MNLVIFLSICVLASAYNDHRFHVKIHEGELTGTTYTLPNGRELQAFYGIPYAAPSIGEERFEEPKPPQPWKGVRAATSPGNQCLQTRVVNSHDKDKNHLEMIGDEDCLYLNVFTPKLPNDPNDEAELMNVMVYIHGGGFAVGSANDGYPDYISQYDDIVFVAMNYRLGVFGFFSAGNPLAPGNNGLKDQVEALRWVQRNIRHFGGNPAKVTIHGCSAGLFHSAISSSGAVSLPWSLPDGVVKASLKFAASLECGHKNAFAMMKCLKSKPASEVIRAGDDKYHKQGYLFDFPYAPVIEPPNPKAFLSENPYTLLREGKIKHIPWMTGLAESEGALYSLDTMRDEKIINKINNEWNEILPIMFKFKYKNLSSEYEQDYISASIRKYYMENKPLSDRTAKHFFQALTDRQYYTGVIDTGKLYAAASLENSYCYKFYYQGTESYANKLSDPKHNYGALHGEDTFYIVKSPDGKSKNKMDLGMAKLLSSSYISFMKTGNPNIPELRTEWQRVSGNRTMNCLGIYSHALQRMEDIENRNTTRFWNHLLPPGKYEKCDVNGNCHLT